MYILPEDSNVVSTLLMSCKFESPVWRHTMIDQRWETCSYQECLRTKIRYGYTLLSESWPIRGSFALLWKFSKKNICRSPFFYIINRSHIIIWKYRHIRRWSIMYINTEINTHDEGKLYMQYRRVLNIDLFIIQRKSKFYIFFCFFSKM